MLEISSEQDGQTFETGAGDSFQVVLAENRTTGFRWHLESSGHSKCILAEETFKPDSNKPGAGGRRLWRFQAAEPGTEVLRFVNRRSWGDSAPESRRFAVTVIIRSDSK